MAMQAAAQANVEKSGWEREQERRGWKEGDVKLPAYPKSEGLIEFEVVGGSFRFFIDADSLSVSPDGVVRYTLVARSPAGHANISYEGIRCASGAYKVFALGNDERWSSRESEWRRIEPKGIHASHHELRRTYFCPNGQPIETAAEGIDALRRHGHPAISIRRFY